MGVSINGGTPKSSTSMGFSIIDHPLWGTPILGKPPYWIVDTVPKQRIDKYIIAD